MAQNDPPTPVAAGAATPWLWLGGTQSLFAYGSGSVRVETSTDVTDVKTNILQEAAVPAGTGYTFDFPKGGCFVRVFCVSGSNVSVGWSA